VITVVQEKVFGSREFSPVNEDVEVRKLSERQIAIHGGRQGGPFEWDGADTVGLQHTQELEQFPAEQEVAREVAIEMAPELIKGGPGDQLRTESVQIPVQECGHPVCERGLEEVLPVRVLLDQRPNPSGRCRVRVGPGAAEQQLVFKASTHR
jgi:hypothetical protein